MADTVCHLCQGHGFIMINNSKSHSEYYDAFNDDGWGNYSQCYDKYELLCPQCKDHQKYVVKENKDGSE